MLQSAGLSGRCFCQSESAIALGQPDRVEAEQTWHAVVVESSTLVEIQTPDLDAQTQGALMYSSPQSAVYFFQCICMLT